MMHKILVRLITATTISLFFSIGATTGLLNQDIGSDGCNQGFGATDCGYNVDSSAFNVTLPDETQQTGLSQPILMSGFTLTNATFDEFWQLNVDLEANNNFFISSGSSFQRPGLGDQVFFFEAADSIDILAANLPAPPTAVLFGVGLLGMVTLRRRPARRQIKRSNI